MTERFADADPAYHDDALDDAATALALPAPTDPADVPGDEGDSGKARVE